jgi:hypothetical protein
MTLDYIIHPSRDFQFGRVFKILWTEPKGQGLNDGYGTDSERATLPTKFGEDVYTTIRRFVVVKPAKGHCLCLCVISFYYESMLNCF